MMNLSEQSRASIASTLKDALACYVANGDRSVVTDIHLQPKQDSGELIVCDDDDKELSRTIINEWVAYDDDDFYAQAEPVLRAEVATLKDGGVLENLCLTKPYSFVLVDEEKETVSELLLLDENETLLLNEELLKGLDQELDEFLKELLDK